MIIKHRKYKVNEIFFDFIDTEEKAYWLGFLYADGWVSESGKIGLRLQIRDGDHIYKFKKALESEHPIKNIKTKESYIQNRKIKSTEQLGIIINSKRMVYSLKELGCPPSKSLTLTFPSENQIPLFLVRHFIRGYLDGDGCISSSTVSEYPNKIKYEITICGTKKFLQSIRDIFLNISGTNGNLYKSSKIWALKYGGNHACCLIGDWLYKNSNISLDRKLSKYKKMVENGFSEKGLNHHRAKKYNFLKENGEILQIKNLKMFCESSKDYPCYENMSKLATGKLKKYKDLIGVIS